MGVIFCVVPDIVWRNCRPKSRLAEGIGPRVTEDERRERARGQVDLFETYDVEPYQYSVDFRRQLKARSMQFEIPIQIVRESTLELTDEETRVRHKTPLSDRAWNILTTIYYKCGGKPWKLNVARDGVCYVGFTYRRLDPKGDNRTACCAAQMFLDDGDGVVIRGEDGQWYSPKTNQFHITRSAAKDLLTKVLTTYEELGGKPLKEVFLHYRASISDTEYEGFKEACPEGVKLIAVRVREERADIRLYREGKYPVPRGLLCKVNPIMGYLWSSGYKTRLGTYDGSETPVPLRISIEHGDADLTQVATDIFGLTKLNYNECRLGDATPVTITFSEDVGEILVSNPNVKNPSPKFKFYI